MKLNLVADYDICGKRFVSSFSIDSSNNLVGLSSLTSLQFPTTDGGFVSVAPKILQMCETKKKAEEVEELWKNTYREEGKLYDYNPIDLYEFRKTAA